MFQYALSDRIRIIEAYFRNDPEILVKEPFPFQIYHWWFLSYVIDEPIFEYEKKSRPQSHYTRLWKAMKQRFVLIPYVPIILICLILVARS